MAKVIIQYVREATEDVIAHHREAIEEHGMRATGRPVTFVRKRRNRRSEIPHHSARLPYVLVFRDSALPQERSPAHRCAAASESG